MTQNGGRRTLFHRTWEDYQSMHQACQTIGKSQLSGKGGKNVDEIIYTQKIATGGAGASIRCRNLCGLTAGEGAGNYSLAGIGKTETALKVYSSAADATLEHAVITAHYLDQDLVAHTATIADAVADMNAAAVDFDTPVTDFYCWDIETYNTSCFTSSITPGAGKTLNAGPATTGYAQIINTALVATKLSLLAVGTVYGYEAANQADPGYISTLKYKNPIGRQRTVTWTLPADSSVATLFLDANGFPVQDFYRPDNFTMDHATLDECFVSNSDKSLIYCGIDDTESEAVFSDIMAFGLTYGRTFLGDIIVTYPLSAEMVTMTLTYHEKGALAPRVESWDCQGVVNPIKNICVELEPKSEVTLVINDDGVTGANANIAMRFIEIPV